MSNRIDIPSTCPAHGKPTKRSSCRQCNAAYMRPYMRARRLKAPAVTMVERARRRARDRGLPFELNPQTIIVPATCPVLGIPLILGAARSPNSPSLDRIVPSRGYVPGNVRVVSDRANRLKGDRDLSQLQHRAATGPATTRRDYEMAAAYVDRESLLAEVRAKAAKGGRVGQEWQKIAQFLDRVFASGGVQTI